MAMERVVSKNLFNFQWKGELGDDNQQAKAARAKIDDPIKLIATLANLPHSELTKSFKNLCESILRLKAGIS
jgi:hypothetical protein